MLQFHGRGVVSRGVQPRTGPFVASVDAKTREALAAIDARLARLPDATARRRCLQDELERARATARRITPRVVVPIVASLAVFFGGIAAITMLEDLTIRRTIGTVLIAQMVVVLWFVVRLGAEAGAQRNVIRELSRRLREVG